MRIRDRNGEREKRRVFLWYGEGERQREKVCVSVIWRGRKKEREIVCLCEIERSVCVVKCNFAVYCDSSAFYLTPREKKQKRERLLFFRANRFICILILAFITTSNCVVQLSCFSDFALISDIENTFCLFLQSWSANAIFSHC